VRAWFEKNGDRFFGSWFWHPPIDVMGLAAVRLMSRRCAMSDFKLLTVAKVLGSEVYGEKVHDAKYDIALTMEMYRRLIA
jgi:DNA polymerase-3 subunit epsilon